MYFQFGILTFLLFAAEVAAIVMVYVFNPQVRKVIEDSMHQYNTSELVKSVWDSVQSAVSSKCVIYEIYLTLPVRGPASDLVYQTS